ncbi:protein ecdysoneless homolog isoform X2 [Nematostella vectensis]|uniref:protein ecdysoneless homolog isoform X2 n=1 Tax=Nematostella vectensis TaxID=45351 RepID=UPI0020774A51|nr:protein ecdysoneless homolog isoform X2 [Nematostella vectensis]
MDDSTVEYRVYIRDILTSGTGQLETVLESRLVEYLAFFSPLIGDYIWQNQAFNLTSVKSESPPCLMGRVDFGDSVDDEWFIVYLLTQLSIKYPDVCISVHDSDGEFLLIEAAHVIPKWLKPESSKNRVFIQGGNVHIIPLPSSPGEITIFPTGWPTLIISLQLVFGPHETAAAQEIQQAIKQRLDRFPDAVQEMFHHANLYVPPGVKYLLEKNLALVSQAVNAFYHRDPRDMKACRQMKYFPPDQTVRTRVRFTKCLYAQLAQRQFLPDRASSWKLPPASHPHHGNHALGYKLTCGFEILCSKASSDCKQAIPSGPRWERYLNCLLNQGYFKGEVDGSQGYNKLLQSARIHFQESCATDESFDTNNWSRGSNSDVGSTILAMLDGADIDVEQMKREESQLPPEDDDSWLDVSPEQLDALLMSYRNTQQTADPASSHQEAQDTQIDAGFDLDHVTRSMNAFVENVSSYEGAEFPRWKIVKSAKGSVLLSGSPAKIDSSRHVTRVMCEFHATQFYFSSGAKLRRRRTRFGLTLIRLWTP